ncbi:MAG: CDP-alcohol phosphatidyltransferase family protein [Deltaproteobacteria bacterium]|nr:CDP-alcohol phosphatidyltransferase family protein [Deltaproteobacteria bacterium]
MNPADPASTKPPPKYQVRDEELLLDFYRKLFWNRLVPKIPTSITPNTLTIVGQLCALLSAVATGAAVAGHPVFYLVSAFLLVAYLTFDNIDGAHARRTQQTSVLGEFLDHGLDGLASTAILIVTGYVLTIDQSPLWFVLLAALGAFSFTALFWEQFRTGLLVIPRFSSTEGITVLFVYQLVRFFAGSPEWLAFSLDHITAGTVLVLIVLLGYAGAAIPSVMRASKVGVAGWELVPLLVLMASQLGFAALGGHFLIPAAAVGILGANVTCRLIILRHRGGSGPFIAPWLFSSVVPLVIAVALPTLWTPSGWALVSLGILVVDYGKNLIVGGNELLHHAPTARTA